MRDAPKAIRVVRIIDRLNIGGPAKHVTWLAAGLDAKRFETTLVAGTVPPGEGDMSYFARAAGVEPVIIPEMSRELSARDLLVIAKLVRLFLRVRPDVIHTHKAKAGAVGRIAALLYQWLTPGALLLRPRRCVVLHTFHGHIFHSYYGRAKTAVFVWIERLLARCCTDRIITISEQQRHEINETFGVGRRAQFRVIPLGIDFAELAQGAREAPAGTAASAEARSSTQRENPRGTAVEGVSSPRTALRGSAREHSSGELDRLVKIGIVGRLCEVKNHALFLDAAAGLNDGSAQFWIVGDGHLRAELEAQCESLHLRERVVFTGFRADVGTLYHELDIVALTSLNEGTPLTLIEAMSCGCPAVATAVGGVIDLMGARVEERDGLTIWEHGLTVPSRDAQAFSRALRFLIERPALRRQMGQCGRRFVRTRLSKERLIADIEQLYLSLLAEPSMQVQPEAWAQGLSKEGIE